MLQRLREWAKRIKTRREGSAGTAGRDPTSECRHEFEARQWLALRRLHTPMLFRVLPILHAPLRKFSTQAGAVADTALRLSTGEPNQRLTAVAIPAMARNSVVQSLISGPRRHKAFR